MKIIFLDIDGVLNNHKSYGTGKADMWCVAALNDITDRTGAAIVVSSTWRMGGLLSCRDKLAEWGVTAPVIDRTPIRETLHGDLTLADPRGFEIAEWWCQHAEIESFVILDDDSDMAHLKDRLVQTDRTVGLTMRDAKRAIALLNRQLRLQFPPLSRRA